MLRVTLARHCAVVRSAWRNVNDHALLVKGSQYDIFLYKTRSSISKTYREPYQLDFFDIASVTDDEIREWVTKVGKHDYDTQRGKTYARQYNVADKIRRQKQEGTLQQTLSSTRTGWID